MTMPSSNALLRWKEDSLGRGLSIFPGETMRPQPQPRSGRAMPHTHGFPGANKYSRRSSWSPRPSRRGIRRPLRRGHAFHSNVHRVIGCVPEILHPVFEWRIPARFAGLGEHLTRLAVLIGKAQMSFREDHHHTTGMVVQRRLFVRSIVDRNHLYRSFSKSLLIMLWFNFGGILPQLKPWPDTLILPPTIASTAFLPPPQLYIVIVWNFVSEYSPTLCSVPQHCQC